MLENADLLCRVIFINFFSCTCQFFCLFHNVAIVLEIISISTNYDSVGIFTYSWLNVVSHVPRWYLRMRSNFKWITTRHITSIDVCYYWILNGNEVLLYFRLMSLMMKIFKTNLQLFKFVILWNVRPFIFLPFRRALFPVVWPMLWSFFFLVTVCFE